MSFVGAEKIQSLVMLLDMEAEMREPLSVDRIFEESKIRIRFSLVAFHIILMGGIIQMVEYS